jgi:endoglucanase
MLRAPDLWAAYKAAFISPGGRVVDNANRGISHSEGQGYAMLLAVAADDRDTFERLWAWTRSELMLREDGLAAWRWDPSATPPVSDRNNATDGDLLIAWALAEAGDHWSAAPYQTAALQLAHAIGEVAVAKSRFGPVFVPGVVGFSAAERQDGPVVNLSYWVFPALMRMDALDPGQGWMAAFKSGIALASNSRFGKARLPTDWISIAAEQPRPAAGFPPTFGYDAIRIPLYLAWAGQNRASVLGSFAALWSGPGGVPQRLDVVTGQVAETLSDSGYRAVAALVRCALDGTKLPVEIKSPTVDRYYPTTLRALVLIASRQRYPQCS